MLLKKIYIKMYKILKSKVGKNVFIAPTAKLIGQPIIRDNVTIHSRCLIENRKGANLVINEGTEINVDGRITSSGQVVIGKNVLFGPNVYVSDSTHLYENINIPICSQKIVSKGNLSIGDGSWLCKNAVIVGAVNVGKHCVIGAGAVVTKDIPDYCVVVGNPGKVIKKFNIETNKWERV